MNYSFVKFLFHWDWIEVYFINLPNTHFVWQHVKWPNINISICQSQMMPLQNELPRSNKSEILLKKLIIMIIILVLKVLVDPFLKSGIKGQEP